MRFPSALRSLAASLLSLQLAAPFSLFAQQPASAPTNPQDTMAPPPETLQPRPAAPQIPQIPQDERLMLVLNRFTYGPRPGDLQRLRTLGLQAWFDQQLNPSRIDDSALDARLAAYPAMQLPLDKLMQLYPNNAQIRASLDHRAGIPGGDAAHAIYHDQQEQYKIRKAAKADKAADANAPKPSPTVELPRSPEEILAMPPDQRFKALCHLTLPQLRELRRTLQPAQRDQLVAGFTPAQIEVIAAFNGPSGVIRAEDIQVKLLRDVYSERQLQEVMVDFWLNHFNVYMNKSQDTPYYIAAYERNAIRPFALGRFENLLIATATSPAMLNYLDNSSSVGPHSSYATGNNGPFFRPGPRRKDVGLNENYAREVMELHSVGVNGGYTQRDVTELAKVFTGWTVGKRSGQDVPAQAQYDPSKHEPGPKVVMGLRVKDNGQKEGIEVLKMLAASPQCARFISTKLAVRFVSDAPPRAMVDRMTQAYLESHGDIRQVLLAMINSPEFFTAPTYRVKLKTPLDFVVSAVRATGAKVDSTAGMAAAIEQLGMPLYGHQTPDGYSMKAEAWNSTNQLVSRMNFAMALATNRVAGLHTDPDALLNSGAASAAVAAGLSPLQKTQALEAVLLHDPVSDRTQQLILAQVSTDRKQQTSELRQVASIRNDGDPLKIRPADPAMAKPLDPTATDPQAALATGLILGSPEFQRR
jgi:uncharacterized protein (DUF1800 family)